MSAGLQHIAEIGVDRYQRIPREIRIAKSCGWLRAAIGVEVPDAFKGVIARCESGAEARFLWEFCTRPGVRVLTDDLLGIPPLGVFPQYAWDHYRLDFYLTGETRQLCVEIDGLGFHHQTADQVEDDYARTRRIVAGLCPVIRFSAGEVFRDAAACWRDVDAYFQTARAA